jgi:hypothetical protein
VAGRVLESKSKEGRIILNKIITRYSFSINDECFFRQSSID